MIGFVIPYYKALEDLERCKACISQQKVCSKIFVHDNSIDNLYFTAGVNRALKRYFHERR